MTDTLVLCYHAISDTWPAALAVSQKRFADQLELLASRGYRGVTFADAVGRPSGGRRVAVTFDDAFHSVLDSAFPVLDRLGWPATVFVVTDFGAGTSPLRWPGIDHWSATPHAGELEALSWEEFRRLRAAGWEIGSHTCSHPYLTRLSDSQLLRELRDSRALCEQHFDAACGSVAYPYGDCDSSVVSAAAAAGYSAGAALPARLHASHPLQWPRVGVYNGDRLGRFALKASPVVRRMRTRIASRNAV